MERQELLTLRSDCILGYCRDKFWTPARAIMPVFAIDLQGLLVTGLIYAPLGHRAQAEVQAEAQAQARARAEAENDDEEE